MRFAVMAMMLAVTPAAAQEIPALPAWMAGAWQQEGANGAWAEEYWTQPRGGMMIGAALR